MTLGDEVRTIKKQSLTREINYLKNQVRGILNNDPNSSEKDPDIIAYKQVIKEKERELELM